MAQEFTEADLSPFFRSNGTSMPEGDEYQALAKNGFADWQLEVGRAGRETRQAVTGGTARNATPHADHAP